MDVPVGLLKWIGFCIWHFHISAILKFVSISLGKVYALTMFLHIFLLDIPASPKLPCPAKCLPQRRMCAFNPTVNLSNLAKGRSVLIAQSPGLKIFSHSFSVIPHLLYFVSTSSYTALHAVFSSSKFIYMMPNVCSIKSVDDLQKLLNQLKPLSAC